MIRISSRRMRDCVIELGLSPSYLTSLTRGVGRRSLAETYYEQYEEDKAPGVWLVVYDFKGVKPSTKFWDNLNRLKGLSGGTLLQYSVFMTRDSRAARAARDLVEHYAGVSTLFRGELMEE